jgi:hypothetical protein
MFPVIAVVVSLAAARRGSRQVRPLWLALACGVDFGVNAFLLKLVPDTLPAGFSDPLLSIGVAHAWLGETITSTPLALAGEVTSLTVMTGGIVALAHRAPPSPAAARYGVPDGLTTRSLTARAAEASATVREDLRETPPAKEVSCANTASQRW